jgi:hypothetical protein
MNRDEPWVPQIDVEAILDPLDLWIRRTQAARSVGE